MACGRNDGPFPAQYEGLWWEPPLWFRVLGRPDRHDTAARERLSFGEVVRINALQLVGGIGPHPDAMVDHELRELLSVDQNHLGLDTAGELRGRRGERGRRDEDALPRALSMQGPDEFLDLRPTVLAHRLAWI